MIYHKIPAIVFIVLCFSRDREVFRASYNFKCKKKQQNIVFINYIVGGGDISTYTQQILLNYIFN